MVPFYTLFLAVGLIFLLLLVIGGMFLLLIGVIKVFCRIFRRSPAIARAPTPAPITPNPVARPAPAPTSAPNNSIAGLDASPFVDKPVLVGKARQKRTPGTGLFTKEEKRAMGL